MAVLQQPGFGDVSVKVRYFAGVRAAAGVTEEQVTLASPATAPATVGALVTELIARHGADLARVLAASSFIVNEIAAGPEQTLDDGVLVDVLPPFAGG